MLFFYNFAWIPLLVDEGRMDGFFLRPLPIFMQLLLSQFSVNAIGDLLVGFSTLGVALALIHVHWTIALGLYVAAAVVAGALVEGAVQLTLSCLLLRSPGSRVLGSWVDELMSTFGNYPLSILPTTVQGLFTFVLPLAFVAYFPVEVILGIAPKHGATSVLTHWSPVVGFVLFFLASQVVGIQPAPLSLGRRLTRRSCTRVLARGDGARAMRASRAARDESDRQDHRLRATSWVR